MIYTFEINSQEYVDAAGNDNTKGIYTLNVAERFPELVGKRVIVSPNWWRFDGIDLQTDGVGITTGYVIHSNLFNMNSITKSGKSSNILFPFSVSATSYYSYDFETIMPSFVKVYLTKFSDTENGVTPSIIATDERLIVSFNVIEN